MGARTWRRQDRRGGLWRAGCALGLAVALAACATGNPSSEDAGSSAERPAFFLARPFAGRGATRAIVDADTIWLVDENGDFVNGRDPADQWTVASGLPLSWAKVRGAARYRVIARNTIGAPDSAVLATIAAPDPTLDPTVVATGLNPWNAGLGHTSSPWSAGNGVAFAVVAESASGSVLSTSAALVTADEFPGMLTTVEVDRPGLAAPFALGTERGSSFTKSFHLGFTEPMQTVAVANLVPLSTNVVVRRIKAAAWGTERGPDVTSPALASHAWLDAELAVTGACTETTVDRYAGDRILAVRDASYFPQRPDARVVFLATADGAFLAEGAGVSAVNLALGRVTLSAPLSGDVPVGSLACVFAGGPGPVPRLVAGAGPRLVVDDATPFWIGEPVLVYEPQVAGTGQVSDVRTVTGVDTATRTLVLDAPLAAGHGTSSAIVPLPGLGGEVTLRPSMPLVLRRDALGGADAELFLAAPAPVRVGDTVLVDGDGDLGTTPDQVQARVKQVRLAPASGTAYSIVVDLPDDALLLHGLSVVVGLGDAFQVGGTRDSSASAPQPLDRHADQFSPDGFLF